MEPLRHSQLKKIGECPAKYAANVERESSFFDKGTGVHSALLGGKRIVTWDKKSDNGNQCPRRGKDWDAFNALNCDSLILLPTEYEQVNRMVESIQKNADAMACLNGIAEKTLFWGLDGRPCRGTPDVDGGHFVTELKTTKSSDPREFHWDAKRYCYHGALAWYQDGAALQWARRTMPTDAYIVAVESEPPYVVTVFVVPPRALAAGRAKNREWFEKLRACERAGEFPGYATGIVELEFREDQAA